MPSHREIRDLPYSAEQMFAVVADIEHYPEFLPWCSGLDVRSREWHNDVEVLIAEMRVGYHGVRQHYLSKVTMDKKALTIEAAHVKGPFAHLDNRWRFEKLATGCRVHFLIDFAFKNPLLSALAGIAFDMAARQMADAFVRRAAELYGKSEQTA